MQPTQKQTDQLLQAAFDWKNQGSRSKWRTKASHALWDAVDEIQRQLTGEKRPIWDSADPPKPGYNIYIPDQWYMDHGEDDFCGGLGHVLKVEWSKRYNTHVIEIEERPNHGYFWENYLRGQQKRLKEECKDFATIRRAHTCPDRR